MFMLLKAYCGRMFWGHPYYGAPAVWTTKEKALRFPTQEEAETLAAKLRSEGTPVKVLEI